MKNIKIVFAIIFISIIVGIANVKAISSTYTQYLDESSIICNKYVFDNGCELISFTGNDSNYSYFEGDVPTLVSSTKDFNNMERSCTNNNVKITFNIVYHNHGTMQSKSDCPSINVISKETVKSEEPSSSKATVTPSSDKTTNKTAANKTQKPSYSYRGKEMNVVYIIGMALLVIRIVVPLILIIIGMVGLVKAMTKNDDKDIKSELKKLVPKLIAAIVIFILPSIIALILGVIKQDALWEEYSSCLLKPSSCRVDLWED